MASPLFDLHDDTARLLCSLLDDADLEALTSVSSAARSSFVQSIRDATPRILVLPSASPDRAVTLLRGIEPSRLTRFVWIQVSTPWRVGVLVDCGLAGYVSSVRIVPESSAFDGGAACTVKICETLPRLTSVTKLDISGTPVKDLSFVSGMPQLQELNLSGTQVVDVSRLSSLTRLQSLILEDTLVVDLSCVENMAELQCLRASCHEPRRHQTSVPPLIKLTKLRTLELKDCTLEGTHDLLVVANRLDKLQLCRVALREDLASTEASPDTEDELAHTRRQLYGVSAGGSYFQFGSGKTILSRIDSRLCVVRRRIEENLLKLQSETYLQELHLMLPENLGPWRHQQHDFMVLLGLPRLTSLKVSQTIELPWHYGPDPEEDHNASVEREGRALGKVLVQLTQVKRLKFSGWIDAQATLSRLTHLEHLELNACKPALTRFDWIRSYEGLRSLTIAVSSKRCDLSSIGLLTGLEELDFINRELSGGTVAELSFLGRLGNVKRLHLTGTIHDLSILRGMKSLEVLTIRAGMARVLPISNVDILAKFTRLETLDVAKTMIKDVSPLARLPRLRVVRIPGRVDCTPLVEPEHPKLLRLFHPEHNCLVACPKRNGQPRRKHQDDSPGSEDLSNPTFTKFSLVDSDDEVDSEDDDDRDEIEPKQRKYSPVDREVKLARDAKVRFSVIEGKEHTISSLGLSSSTYFPVITENTDGEWMEVLIPGYGYAWVPRDSIVGVLAIKMDQEPRPRTPRHCVSFNDCVRGALASMVRTMVQSLTVLSISSKKAHDVRSEDILAILDSCPNLKKLHIKCAKIGTIHHFIRAYEENQCRITSLSLVNVEVSNASLCAFAQVLADPTHQMTKTLTEFRYSNNVYWCHGDGHRPDKKGLELFLDMLRSNRTLSFFEIALADEYHDQFAHRFKKLDGRRFSSQPADLPLQPKLALLSCVSIVPDNRVKRLRPSRDQEGVPVLSRGIISNVFGFARRRVVRNVSVVVVD